MTAQLLDGKALASRILDSLRPRVRELSGHGHIPTIGVILVGDDMASRSYIRQKQRAAESVGVSVRLVQLPATAGIPELAQVIRGFNNDPAVHGVIIQRPVPIAESYALQQLLNSVATAKDVDGLVPDSPFAVPVARAIQVILERIHAEMTNVPPFTDWIRTRRITIIGRGETAGRPIAALLEKLDCATSVVHTQTPDPAALIRQADVVISCAGKPRVVRADLIRPGAILIAVGIWRDDRGKLHGDYDEAEIREVASWYTPTPGGVGPVNVACLIANVVEACTILQGGSV